MAPNGKGRSLFILQQRPWNLETVTLGRFVLSTNDPHQDFYVVEDNIVSPLVTKLQNINSFNKFSTGTSFSGGLVDLFATKFSRHNEGEINVQSNEAKVYQLQNQTSWFKTACAKVSTRSWLEQVFNAGSKVFLIVGFLTLVDAHTIHRTMKSSTTGGEVIVPVTAALASTGVVLPSLIGNPQVGSEVEKSHETIDGFLAPGEMVFAVEYRRVRLEGFFKRSVERVGLKENQWVSSLGITRGQQSEKILEAEVEEDDIWDEAEDEELEYVAFDDLKSQ